MIEVIKSAADRCDMVIMTGGLGPTLDDLSREAVAKAAGVSLEFRQDLMDQIEQIFRRAGYKMSENNRRQAYVPAGSQAIPNPTGTAPGFICDVDQTPVICLPGVPRELEYLTAKEVIPWVQQRFGLHGKRLTYRVLKTVGIGESKVDTLIGDLIKPGENPEVGLLASQGEIKIRIAVKATSENEIDAIISPVAEEIKSRLGNKIF
jgi:molybdopterin-biosynthesis enzyme MoeA-like protein